MKNNITSPSPLSQKEWKTFVGKHKIFFLTLFLFPLLLSAQIDTISYQEKVQDGLLERFESLVDDEDGNIEELEEQLIEEQENREKKSLLNLNQLSSNAAFEILKLSDYQYYQLQAYICDYGELASIYELTSINGFTFADLERMKPYIKAKFTPKKNYFFKNFFKKSKNSLLIRYSQILENQAGYDTNLEKHYLGSPQRVAFKYQFNSQDKFMIAISGEKDAGEEFFKGTQKQGFDFYSGYICLKDISIIKKAIVGDYKLDFGQGLVVGSALMSGKGAGVSNVRRFAGNVRPVAPLNEGNFLRGAAVEIGNYHYSGTIFAGFRHYDGSLSFSTDSTPTFDGSLSSTGYHRTQSEWEKKNGITSWVCGGDFNYRGRVFKVGARAVHTQLNCEKLPSDKPYQKFNFSGRGMSNFGIDYQLVLKKTLLFGEAGVSGNGGWAALQGILFDLAPGASFAALAHYHDTRYIALQGSGFGAASGEWGVYLTSQIIVNAHCDLSCYYDFCQSTWLKYRTDAPSNTMQAGLNIAINPGRNANINFKYQFKKKEKNNHTDELVNGLVPFYSSRFRLSGSCQVFDFLKLKSEVNFVINHSKSTNYKKKGFLIFQDISINIKRTGLGFDARVAYFDTDSYEERLYAYENDLYYSFTINSHYGKGCRAYLLLRYSYKFIHFWVRISQSYYFDRKIVSSGLEEIASPHKTELKMQLMFKF